MKPRHHVPVVGVDEVDEVRVVGVPPASYPLPPMPPRPSYERAEPHSGEPTQIVLRLHELARGNECRLVYAPHDWLDHQVIRAVANDFRFLRRL
jgi:hypothetical protein